MIRIDTEWAPKDRNYIESDVFFNVDICNASEYFMSQFYCIFILF